MIEPTDGVAERPGRSVRPLATGAAALAALGFAGLAWFVLSTAAGQRLDEDAMRSVVAGRDTQDQLLSVLGYVSIGAVALMCLGAAALALLRGRVVVAVAAVGVIMAANLTTQVLKHALLDRAELVAGVAAPNSLPSGHTTVVAAGLGALFLASPRWLRPVAVALGAFALTLTGTSTVVAGWHRPSDVVAAALIALGWTAVAAVVVDGEHRPLPGTVLLAVLGAAGAMVFLVVIGVRPSYGWAGALDAAVVLGSLTGALAVITWLTQRISPTY